MKVEQLIVQYLYNNKRVSIPEVGIFSIVPGTLMPDENSKDNTLPLGSIEFEYKTQTEIDEGLINFIVTESGKMRPLATSDLESYIILSRQFLNIGKPLVIAGLGTLVKTQQGTYDFTQGTIVNPRLDSKKQEIKEKIQDDITFSSLGKTTPNKNRLKLMMFTLFLLFTAAALYYFLVYNKNKTTPITTETVVFTLPSNMLDTNNTMSAITPDSLSNILLVKDSMLASLPSDVPGSNDYTFEVIIKEYDTKANADKAFNILTSYGHQLLLQQKVSGTYQLLMPFKTALSDTARAKDSVRILFGGKPFIKLK
ncbi:MAG: hypothetical protein WD135_09465 [Ferruginibacter sp.]